MNYWLKTQSYPVRFLLYLEWGLLTIAIAAISLELILLPQIWQYKVFDLLMLAVFVLLGVTLPSGKFATKMLYVGIQFSLVLAWLALSGSLWLLSVLLLILMIRSCFLLPLPGRWVVAGSAFAMVLLARMQQLYSTHKPTLFNQLPQYWISQWSDIFWFGIVLLLLIQLMQYVLVVQQMQQQLAREQQRWQQYTQQQEELTALQARHHVACESYDALGHALAAINIQLQSALKFWSIDPSQAQEFLAQAQWLGVTTMQEIRNSMRGLRIHTIPPQVELPYEQKDQGIP
ncbi:histidine kinase [Scytonema sp. NUACC26]|uniref:histidine kinase n=1 Tax=Scytonema sp. NUACC26 TaxID=3140176 RepID=UPI0034DBE384